MTLCIMMTTLILRLWGLGEFLYIKSGAFHEIHCASKMLGVLHVYLRAYTLYFETLNVWCPAVKTKPP